MLGDARERTTRYCWAISCALFIASFASNIYAAKVTAISAKNAQVLVNEGSSSGVKPKSQVCFYDGSGKKVTCGVAYNVKEDKTYVKLKDAKLISKIKKGMEAKFEGGGKGGKSGAAGGESNYSAFRAYYLFTPSTPATINAVSYKAPTATGASTLWAKEQQSRSSLIAGGGALEFPIGSSMGMDVGLRYRLYFKGGGFIGEADHEAGDTTEYVRTEQNASALGFFFDFFFLRTTFSGLKYQLGSGLDFDQTSATFKATLINESTNAQSSIMTGTSKLMVVSLRIPNTLTFQMGSFGIGTHLNILLPIAAVGASDSYTPGTDTNFTDLAGGKDTAADDIKTAIGLKKNSLGLETGIHIAILF